MGRALPRVCILYANSGGGHRSVALSLVEAFAGLAEPTLVNLLDDYAPFPWNRLSGLYGPWTHRAPALWSLVYRYGASRRRVALTERAIYGWVRPHVVEPFLERAGDLVISVHPIQTGVALRLLREAGRRTPFVTMVTDPVIPPLAWLCPDVDLCLVATERARAVAEAAGVPGAKVRVTGLPVRRSFSTTCAIPRSAARRRLGLEPETPLILLAGGGAGIGPSVTLLRALIAALGARGVRAQLAVLTGHNAALRHYVQNEQWSLPVHALGFIGDPAVWFWAASLLLTKAGPTTLYEASSVGLPMILTGFIPGQEAPNVAWAVEAGAGVYAPEPRRAAALAAQWLDGDPAVLDTIGARARALSQPAAAAAVAQLTLSLLPG